MSSPTSAAQNTITAPARNARWKPRRAASVAAALPPTRIVRVPADSIRTVVRMLTPSAAATWRWVEKIAVARPVSSGVMLA